ncbi:MAG: AAA family ATPase [Nitrospirae bacterium]|nr:AAA family ATPase [Nitrospirota bacterium]
MKGETGSPAKITRPHVSDIFPRKRLFRLLDDNRKHSVVWLSAPAGSGKTTLVASYLDEHRLPFLWYQVDRGDDDLAAFFYYMGHAAKRAAPRYRKPLPLLTPEYLPGLSTFTRRYFEEIYKRVRGVKGSRVQVKTRGKHLLEPLTPRTLKPFCIVFDNYQEVPAGSMLHETINAGLDLIPDGIRAIIISRAHPPDAYARMRSNDKITVIDDIRLTEEETAGLMKMKVKGKVTPECVRKVHEKTQGWAAGIVLMLEKARQGMMDAGSMEDSGTDTIFDYFATEIFQKVDVNTQVFLLKTAFFPDMNLQMAERLTRLENADHILSELTRNNFFTEKRHHTNPVYRYHPLFREFLLSQVKDYFVKNDIAELQKKTAAILEESGKVEDAFALYRSACDSEGAIRLIMTNAMKLLQAGRIRTLEGWIAGLPDEIRNNMPWLLYWLGACRRPFNPPESLVHFEKAFELFRAQKDAEGVFLSWSGIVDSIYFGFDDFKRLDRWIKILEALISEFGGIPAGVIDARVNVNMICALLRRDAGNPALRRLLERSEALINESRDNNLNIIMLSHHHLYYLYCGNFVRSGLIVERMRETCKSCDIVSLSHVILKLSEAIQFNFVGDLEKCRRAVDEGLKLSDESGVTVLNFMLMGQLVWISIGMNDFKTAGDCLKKIESSMAMLRPFDIAFYHHLKSCEALGKGDLQQAKEHAELVMAITYKIGARSNYALMNLLYAQVLCELGECGKAVEHISAARDVWEYFKSPFEEFSRLLIEAKISFGQGDEKQGLKHLSQAMTLGRECGYVMTYIWRPSIMANLCATALENGIEVDYVQHLIRKRDLVPENPPVHLDNWPWQLKIYTLGRFGILKDGKPVEFSGKAQKKPLELLKCLIALGGREISEQTITDILWQDADADMARHSFKITLHRLRKLLQHENAIRLSGSHLSLDPWCCRVDVWAFERFLGEADINWNKGLSDNAAQLTEKAVRMYQGAFLSREPEPWITSTREKLRSKFLRNVMKLCHYYKERKQWQKALDCCHKALETDSLAEECYQHLMKCYHQLGRKAEAVAVYEKCRNVLSSSLGVNPSPETERIYREVTEENKKYIDRRRNKF